MGAKFDYYLQKYIENKRNNNPQDILSSMAFKLIGEHKMSEENLLKYKLSDMSDIPSYSKVLLDFQNNTPLETLAYLPYEHPNQKQINTIYCEATAIRKRFEIDYSVAKKNTSDYIHIYYKYVLFLYLLERDNPNVFEKGKSNPVIHHTNFDYNLLKREARSICLESNVDKKKRLQTQVDKLILRIDWLFITNGYTKKEHTIVQKDSKNKEVRLSQVEFDNGKRLKSAPYNSYLLGDYSTISGYNSIYNPETKEYYKNVNPNALPILQGLLTIEKKTELIMNGYKYSHSERGTGIDKYIRTETYFKYDYIYEKYPGFLNDFEVIRFYINDRYNKTFSTKYQSKQVETDLQSYEKRSIMLKVILDELKKSIFGYTKNEIDVISDVVKFYRSKESYEYYPPKRTRIVKNRETFTGSYNAFIKYCNTNNIKSLSMNLVSSYLTKRLSFVVFELNLGTMSKQDIQRRVKDLLRSNNLLKLPDYVRMELSNKNNISINLLKRTLKAIHDYSKK